MAHEHDAHDDNPACAIELSGPVPGEVTYCTLVAVFASSVAAFLLHFAHDLEYRTVRLEPDTAAVDDDVRRQTVVDTPYGR